jgi:hypothetical protein
MWKKWSEKSEIRFLKCEIVTHSVQNSEFADLLCRIPIIYITLSLQAHSQKIKHIENTYDYARIKTPYLTSVEAYLLLPQNHMPKQIICPHKRYYEK